MLNIFDEGLHARNIEKFKKNRVILKSLKKAPLGKIGTKFITKKENAPSCKEFFEIIQLLIFLKIRKKMMDKKSIVPTRPCSDKNSK